MKREWVVVIEINGEEVARSTPRSLDQAHKWSAKKRKYYGSLFQGKRWAVYFETPSLMFKPEKQ
jgi:hypothetical protein